MYWRIFIVFLMGIIKQYTHPQSLPLIPIHPQPPKIMPHTPLLAPSHPKQPTLTHNNASITATQTKYGLIKRIYSNFSLITR